MKSRDIILIETMKICSKLYEKFFQFSTVKILNLPDIIWNFGATFINALLQHKLGFGIKNSDKITCKMWDMQRFFTTKPVAFVCNLYAI